MQLGILYRQQSVILPSGRRGENVRNAPNQNDAAFSDIN